MISEKRRNDQIGFPGKAASGGDFKSSVCFAFPGMALICGFSFYVGFKNTSVNITVFSGTLLN